MNAEGNLILTRGVIMPPEGRDVYPAVQKYGACHGSGVKLTDFLEAATEDTISMFDVWSNRLGWIAIVLAIGFIIVPAIGRMWGVW